MGVVIMCQHDDVQENVTSNWIEWIFFFFLLLLLRAVRKRSSISPPAKKGLSGGQLCKVQLEKKKKKKKEDKNCKSLGGNSHRAINDQVKNRYEECPIQNLTVQISISKVLGGRFKKKKKKEKKKKKKKRATKDKFRGQQSQWDLFMKE